MAAKKVEKHLIIAKHSSVAYNSRQTEFGLSIEMKKDINFHFQLVFKKAFQLYEQKKIERKLIGQCFFTIIC